MLLSEEIQFLTEDFPYLAMSKFSCVRSRLLIIWNVHLVVYFRFLFAGYFCSADACVDSIVSDRCNQPFSKPFLCILQVVSMHQRYLESWRILFLLSMTCAIYLCHLCDIRPYESSWVFLFSGLFVDVLLSSPLRIVPSILPEGQLFWWDFCKVVSFRVFCSL